MKVCVIGGANVDITATSREKFRAGDSNPGTVRLSLGGVGRNIAHNLALLGDEVCFLTRFGDDAFGQMLQASCREIGLDISGCEVCPALPSSCFASLNDRSGEMIGGVADMAVTEGISTQWLSGRLARINTADAVVADTNLLPETLAWLMDHVEKPLYLDAVSGPKAIRLREAGKYVIGMGEKKTPNPFISACDKFIYIEVIRAKYKKEAAPAAKKKPDTKKKPGRRIDFIFTKGPVECLASEVVTDRPNGIYPSDHYFVTAEVKFTK